MINVGLVGATGYTGIECLRLLQSHPSVKITQVVSQQYVGEKIDHVYTHLMNHADLICDAYNLTALIDQCELIFLALPHGQAESIANVLISAGKKVIDLSSDFRLKPEQSVYGLPEAGLRDDIQKSNLIANPGCYPTAAILAALPAIKHNIIDSNNIIFDCKSGSSGAGRSLSLNKQFCEVFQNSYAYQIAGKHRHSNEIEFHLSQLFKNDFVIQFTPHIIPVSRGLMVTAYYSLTQSITEQEIYQLYNDYYQNEYYIRLLPQNYIPQLKSVIGTNYCDIGIAVDKHTNRLIVISVIDNLIKGASGQAIQNMNIMYGLPETEGLMQYSSIYP